MPSERIYELDENNKVEYIGTVEKLENKVFISVDKESDTTYRNTQVVSATLKSYVEIADENIALKYAWVLGEEEPTDEAYEEAAIEGNSNRKIADVSSTANTEGTYYLWLKAIVNNEEVEEKTYGPYNIKEHDTLKKFSGGSQETDLFLGKLQRNMIKSITIKDTLENHVAGEGNCWDVSSRQNGRILAWYEETNVDESTTYYDVYIGQNGGVTANSNSSYLFANIGNAVEGYDVTITGMEKLDTSNVTNMSALVYGSSKLSDIDVSLLDTSLVTNMSYMFSGCSNLDEIDVSNFKTDNVKNISQMFVSCSSIETLDMSKWNTPKLETAERLFAWSSNISTLSIGEGFDTTNVTDMHHMFAGLNKIKEIDVDKIDVSNAKDMSYMFYNCYILENLDLSNWNAECVENMQNMFSNCDKLSTIIFSENFQTNNVTNMQGAFSNCDNLIELDLSGFITTNLTNIQTMFYVNKKMEKLNLSNWDISNITEATGMFTSCSKLKVTVNSQEVYDFVTANKANGMTVELIDTNSNT